MENSEGEFQKPGVQSNESYHVEDLLSTLPREKNWNGRILYKYKGFWYPDAYVRGIILFDKHFQAKDNDIFLITFPKCGTTWLKALTFSIFNRFRHDLESSPLLTVNPHDLIRFLDLDIYNKSESPNLEDLPSPRIFGIHAPFDLLPPSILNSNCRIIYLCRNPFDQFVSLWNFVPKMEEKEAEAGITFEEAFDMFCNGVMPMGPFWKHVLDYWNASIEQPHKILFLKYEDLQDDTAFHVKKIANFLGCPFSKDEEDQGMAEKISKFCSFDNMKDLNKSGKVAIGLKKNYYFRKGKVGDWKNYFTVSMTERLEKLMKENLDGSGLTFKTVI